MNSRDLRHGLLVVITLAAMYVQGASAQAPKDSPIAKWKLKHSCSELRLEPTALVTLRRTPRFYFGSECASKTETERAEIDLELSSPESIPLDSITAIAREVITRRPVQGAIQQTASLLDPEDMLKQAWLDPRAFIMLPLYPVVIVAAAEAMEPFRGVATHINSVRVLWTEDGSPRSTNFLLSRGDAESLLNHLAKATGKSWTSARFDGRRQDDLASQFLVRFSRPVSAQNITVGEGNFRLAIYHRLDSARLVYLLSEDQQNVLTAFTAEATPLGMGKPWIIKLARAGDGSWCLAELNTNLEHLLLRACQR
ncbi:MAG: hypothetical protein WBE10_13630 [Candidatus Acidiferrum sp.]